MASQSQQTGVLCARCRTPIAVENAAKVSEEFSLACPKCGHRGFYHVKDIRMIGGRE
jgi:DNA-directed RNA polymerase subunit RPC12/RpoP